MVEEPYLPPAKFIVSKSSTTRRKSLENVHASHLPEENLPEENLPEETLLEENFLEENSIEDPAMPPVEDETSSDQILDEEPPYNPDSDIQNY